MENQRLGSLNLVTVYYPLGKARMQADMLSFVEMVAVLSPNVKCFEQSV